MDILHNTGKMQKHALRSWQTYTILLYEGSAHLIQDME